MSSSTSWPLDLLARATALADHQQYGELWRLVLQSCFPSLLIAPFDVQELSPSEACRGFAVYKDDPSQPYLVLTYTNLGPRGWGSPFHERTLSRALKATRFYHVHANGTCISCQSIACIDQRLNFDGDEKRNKGWFFSPVRDGSSDPARWSGGERNSLDFLEHAGYAKLLLYATKTRYRAGLEYGSLSSDFRRGPLAVAVPTQWPLTPPMSADNTPASPRSPAVTGRLVGSPSTPNAPALVGLPLDVVQEILLYLSSEDTCNFALASRLCNELANRRLWKVFYIRGTTSLEVLARCRAVARLPHRATFIRRLVVGPCRWNWRPDILQALSSIWSLVPHLQDLLLESDGSLASSSTVFLDGVDYSPLLRNLLTNSKVLDLRVFKCEDWLRPYSPLLRFLETQPSIRELIGVDIIPTRPPRFPLNFLPSLEVLVCSEPQTAALLLPARPVHTVQITGLLDPKDDLNSVVSAFEACSGPLTDITVDLPRPILPASRGLFARLIQCCAGTTRLSLRHPQSQEICELPGTFPSVRTLTYYSRKAERITSEAVANLARTIAPQAEAVVILDHGGYTRREWVRTENDHGVIPYIERAATHIDWKEQDFVNNYHRTDQPYLKGAFFERTKFEQPW